MKRVEILRIDINRSGLFSQGVGEDETGEIVNFIGHTSPTMENILIDLEDFEVHPEHGRPAVYLEAWQVQ